MAKKNDKILPKDLCGVEKELETIISHGYNNYSVFEDWVALMFYSFLKDKEKYDKILKNYEHFKDAELHFTNALLEILSYMKKTNEECLGPLYEKYASSHYIGQYFTPAPVAEMMAQMNWKDMPDQESYKINDPACGAGIGLISVAKAQTFKQNNVSFFVGQDIDLTCCRMTALNLMFFNLEGLIIHCNSLSLEAWGAWRTKRSVAFGGSLHHADLEWAKMIMLDSLKEENVAQ